MSRGKQTSVREIPDGIVVLVQCSDVEPTHWSRKTSGTRRLPKERAPRIPRDGAIPDDPDLMSDEMNDDDAKCPSKIGTGFIDNVPEAVWWYEVSGKRMLTQWFSYRKRNRERPIIGDRRPPSKLGDIHPDHWLAEYTTGLLNVLNVLALLVEMEPTQAELLEVICGGSLPEIRP